MPLPRFLPRGLLAVSLGLLLVPVATVHAVPSFFPSKESKPRRAGLGPREPALKVEFPNAARARGISHGRAEASVLVDADGQPLDFLVTSETDPAFGRALVKQLQTCKFQPAMLQGEPIPARCAFSFDFSSQEAIGVNVLDAASDRSSLGKAKLTLAPVVEAKLDHPLEIIEGNVPTLPKNFPVPDKPVKVSVTFFVDETGQVRTPNIESANPPQVFAAVIAALSTWKCKAPTVGGKPALVFAGRTFMLAAPSTDGLEPPAGAKP
jgi:outer membrane biosynthesis protein TonB